MTRSIFDPTGGETERSGSPLLGPDAANISHMPPDVVDGVVEEDEAEEREGQLEAAAGITSSDTATDRADELPGDQATDSDEAARRLGRSNPTAPAAAHRW